ncbi:UPF0104 family protein [Gemella sp. GH3]|uniref:lysylphosphatidylglycerol synthase domain-containing protein n=1 Tax=unclassified Gemella TaxID=2624949 RepID=UPI0015D0C384|nr:MULTISPECIES: lysylphosphatidylglycerol synthase domain-containing protein [unclassified Gemella]MBF0714092.1 UPF0104 family protein [Gemella sp. GH3.1]NYS51044.1 UPF0104 family protein [Gemella sp. GH3]
MKDSKKQKYSNIIKTLVQMIFGIIIVTMLFSYFKKEIDKLDFNKIEMLISNLGVYTFLFIILLGIVGIAILSFYDFLVLRVIPIKESLKYTKVFKVSFMTNSLNMILGFGGIIGAGLRYYCYKPYSKDNKSLLIAIGMILISMLSGLSMLAILVVLDFLPGADLYSDYSIFYYFLLLMTLFLPIYLFINMKNPKIKNDRYLSIKLAIISFLEWIYAAFLVLFILYIFEGSFIFGKESRILGVIVVASIAGLLSMVPGGVGTFDFLVIIGLKNLGFKGEIVAATIFVYRLSYYVVPFIIGTILFIIEILIQIFRKFISKKEGI